MRDSKSSGKKPIEEVQAPRARKAKLERVSSDIIKAKKAAEDLLRRSKSEWESTFNAMSDWVAMMDLKGTILRTNRAGEDFTGRPLDEIIGQSCCKLVHGEDKRIPGCPLAKLFETGERASTELQVPGTDRWLMVTVDLVTDEEDNAVGAVHITRDITERKKAEDELREGEERFRQVAENAMEWIWEVDREGLYTYASPVVEKILGYKPEEIVGKKHFYDLFQPQESEDLKSKAFEVFAKKETFREFINLNVHKNGKVVCLSTSGVPVLDEKGELLGYRGADADITERKRAEEQIKQSKEFLANTINALDDPVFVKDEEHRWIVLNDSACKVMGRPREELVGKSDYDLSPKEQADVFWEKDNLVFETGKANVNEEEITWQGKLHTISTKKSIFTDSLTGKKFIAGTIRDITERKKAEEKLLEYQAQLRSLASELSLAEERERRRIATELHDQISQSLVISKMKVDRLRESASGKELNKALDEIADSLGHTIADTRSLTSDIHPPLLALLGFEEAVAEWLSEQIQKKHGIAAEFEDDGLPKPLDDDIRILLFRDVRELLTNVVKHAHAHKVKVSIRKVGGQIRVSVEDDGVGFDPAEVASIGLETNGFGLFSIQERLEELGGHLEIEFEPGQGAKVTITALLQAEKNIEGRKI